MNEMDINDETKKEIKASSDEFNTKLKIEFFKQAMLNELKANNDKGNINNFNDYHKIIAEMEYHKAKMLLAIRLKNKQALKEYIADTANYLFMLGNLFGIYEWDFEDKKSGESFEINKDVEVLIKTTTPSKNQSII